MAEHTERSPEVLFHHRHFMGRLDHAIGLQTGVVHDQDARLAQLAQRLLQLPGVRGVRVKIAKLEIFDDCEVAIRIETGQW